MSGKLILLSNSTLLPVGGKGETRLRDNILDQYMVTEDSKHCFAKKFSNNELFSQVGFLLTWILLKSLIYYVKRNQRR